MFCGYQEGRRCLWVNVFLLTVMNLVIDPFASEAFQSSVRLTPPSPFYAERSGLHSYPVLLLAKRTRSSLVETIMTLLATFEEAQILPPEGTAQANQVIHGLIQLQSVLLKSVSLEFKAYWKATVDHWMSQHQERVDGVLEKEGLTDRVLAALILYDQERPMWEEPKVALAIQAFHVTRADWMLVVDLFHQADAVFRAQGRSLHDVYEAWRMNMPHGKR